MTLPHKGGAKTVGLLEGGGSAEGVDQPMCRSARPCWTRVAPSSAPLSPPARQDRRCGTPCIGIVPYITRRRKGLRRTPKATVIDLCPRAARMRKLRAWRRPLQRLLDEAQAHPARRPKACKDADWHPT